MRAREYRAARLACVAANREAVEHHLRKLYRLMGWPAFSHIRYTQSPASYNSWAQPNYDRGTCQRQRQEALHSALRTEPRGSNGDIWRDIAPILSSRGIQNTLRWSPSPQVKELAEIITPLTKELLDFVVRLKVPVVFEKPVEVHFDEGDQPHSMDGPAVIWRDGSRTWWVHGVRVSQRFVEEPPTLAYINKQRNQERKRLLIEKFGEGNYLKGMHAELKHEDEAGKLWRIPSKRYSRQLGRYSWNRRVVVLEASQFVEVVNSSPEPDGSFNKYFLRVPPNIKTAKAAVAWTFRVPKSYRPVVET